MLLRYKGDGKFVSLITGEIYKAKKISDRMGEGYAIFDEGDEWYRYSVQFVKKNFEVLNIADIRPNELSESILKFAWRGEAYEENFFRVDATFIFTADDFNRVCRISCNAN